MNLAIIIISALLALGTAHGGAAMFPAGAVATTTADVEDAMPTPAPSPTPAPPTPYDIIGAGGPTH